jgi:hypothetical protein
VRRRSASGDASAQVFAGDFALGSAEVGLTACTRWLVGSTRYRCGLLCCGSLSSSSDARHHRLPARHFRTCRHFRLADCVYGVLKSDWIIMAANALTHRASWPFGPQEVAVMATAISPPMPSIVRENGIIIGNDHGSAAKAGARAGMRVGVAMASAAMMAKRSMRTSRFCRSNVRCRRQVPSRLLTCVVSDESRRAKQQA